MATVHQRLLEELCCICGIIHRGTVYEVEKFKENIEKAFNFDFDIVTGVTPTYCCNTCYRTVTMYESRVEKGLKYETSKKAIMWKEHCDVDCVGCGRYVAAKKGGRKKKIIRKGREKTVGLWSDELIPKAESNGFQFLKTLDTNKLRFFNEQYEKCVCVICDHLIDGPLIFQECEHGCCRACFLEKFSKSPIDETRCPACNLLSSVAASSLLQLLIRSMCAPCSKGCHKNIPFRGYENHLLRCDGPVRTISLDVGDMIRELLNRSVSGVIEIKTGGQPICLTKVTKTRKESVSVSRSTLRKRSLEIEKFITAKAGTEDQSVVKLKSEVLRRMSKESRNEILVDLGMAKPMSEKDELAIL